MSSEQMWDFSSRLSTLASLVEANAISPNRLQFKLRQMQEEMLRAYYTNRNKEIAAQRQLEVVKEEETDET